MTESAFVEMITLCGTAIGLVLLAFTSALLSTQSRPVRTVAATGCVAAAGALQAGHGLTGPAILAAGVVTAAALAMAAAASPRSAGVRRCLQGRGVQAGCLALASAALFLGSLSRYEIAESAAADRDMAFMREVTWKPLLSEAEDVAVETDLGRRVPMHRPTVARPAAEVAATERRVAAAILPADGVIRTSPPTEAFNCHGWVFTGGRYWVGSSDVETILADNGYQPVSGPRPGDLVVYRGGQRITHTGVVRMIDGGGTVLVESKLGCMGQFLHPPGGTFFGVGFTYYRSPRASHVLVGLGGLSPTTGLPGGPAADFDQDY